MVKSRSELNSEIEDVVNAAEVALKKALESLTRRMRFDNSHTVDPIDRLRHGDHNAWSDFQYDLAKHIAEQLGVLDEDVKAAYIDEHDIVPEDLFFGEAARTTVIFLIVWVQRKTKALNSLVAALDRALVRGFNDLIGKPQLTRLLEVQAIDDDDAKNPAGYGEWLSSDHFYLTEVWRREGVELELK